LKFCFFKYKNEKKASLPVTAVWAGQLGIPLGFWGNRDGTARRLLCRRVRGNPFPPFHWRGYPVGNGGAAAPVWSTLLVFSLFFFPEAAIFFFLEEKETGRWLFDAVC